MLECLQHANISRRKVHRTRPWEPRSLSLHLTQGLLPPVGSAAALLLVQASCVDRQHGMPQIHMLITASWFLLTSGLSGDSSGKSGRPCARSPLRLGPPAAVLNGGAWRWFIAGVPSAGPGIEALWRRFQRAGAL